MKGDDATLVTAFLRLKREEFQSPRDLILALTSDEEGGPANGIQFLVKEHRDLIDAAFAINPDSGGGDIKNGKRLYMSMEAAEKVFASFTLEVTNAGGHSSRPAKTTPFIILPKVCRASQSSIFPCICSMSPAPNSNASRPITRGN